MSIILEIQHGNPWYLSPDVWTVPGSDPTGPPGLPVVGQPCYIWARVHNNGTDPVQNATVQFYWGNPGVGIDRNTATLVGYSFVNLGSAGDSQEVPCLTPWMPSFVNEGHECVLAETFCPADPLPPGPDFNASTDRHVGQHNLSVVMAGMMGRFHFGFEVHNPTRKEQLVTVNMEMGKVEQLRKVALRLGKDFRIPNRFDEIQELGLVSSACPNEEEIKHAQPKIEGLKLPAYGVTGYSLVGRLKGDAALIHVEQRVGQRATGGLSVLVLKGGK